MAKFWRVWRADEIVAVYQKEDSVTIHLRNGNRGVAHDLTTSQVVREIEAVLAAEDSVRLRLKDELQTLQWKIKEASRELSLLRSAKSGLPPTIAKEIIEVLVPVLHGPRNYLYASEKKQLLELLQRTK